MVLGRGLRILLEVLGGLAALAVVALAVAFWRVTTGPVSVDFLTPYLERSFSAEGIEVDVGRTQLTWDGVRRDIELEAREWRIRDAEGQPLAYLPRVVLSLSLQAMLRGTIAATSVELDRARLRILRDQSGRFAFAGPLGETEEVPDLSAFADAVLERMMQPPDPAHPVSYLQRIDIRNARILFDDRRLGRRLEVRDAGLQIWREVGGLGGQLAGRAALGGAEASLASSLWYRADRGLVQVGLTVEELELAEVAAWAGLEQLDGVALSLDAVVDADVPIDGRLPSGSFSLRGKRGSVEMPAVFSLPFAIAGLEAEGAFDGPAQRLDLRSLSMQLGEAEERGPLLAAQAEIARSPAGLDLAVEALVTDVTVEDLRNYWPIVLRDGGRPWVATNITAGTAPQGSVRARVTLPDEAGAEPLVHELAGDFSFRDLEVHYLRPLPPAVGVGGLATFDADAFYFTVESAALDDLRVPSGRVVISGLQEPVQYAEIDFPATGPLPTVLRLLEHPRLDLLRELGFTSEGSEGQAEAQVRFLLPLESNVTFDDVEVGVNGTLDAVLLRRAVMEQDLAGGPLALALNQDGMRVEGALTLGGVEARDVLWTEAFAGAGERTRVQAFVPRLDDADRVRFGFDTAPTLTGPVSARLQLGADASGDARVDIDLDLLQAEVRLDEVAWSKARGFPGDLSMRLHLQRGRPVALEELQVVAGSLALLGGRANFGAEGEPWDLYFPEAALGATEVQQLSLRLLPDGGAEVEIGAGRLDLEPFLRDEEAAAPEAPVPGAVEPPPPPLRIVAPTLAQVSFGDDRYLQAVELRVHRDAGGWQDLVLRGEVPRHLWRYRGGPSEADAETLRKRVSLVYGRALDRPGYALNLEADDLGASLRAIDLFDTLEGGALTVAGRSEGPLPDFSMLFEVWAEDYTLVEAPAMARLLTIASLSGLGNLLAGEGIAFQRLVGEVQLEGDRLSTDLLRAYGPSLGITARGHLDLEGEDSLLRGTLVPAYSINQVLGAIPLLGFLLTGGQGEGVLGVTYRLTGSLDEPQFSVNPLSVLAPGFLRGLFDLPPGDGEGSAPSAFPDDYPDDTMIGN